MIDLRRVLLVSSLAAFVVSPVLAQDVPTEGPVPTSALISAESKSGAPLDPSLVTLEINGHATPLSGVTPVQPAAAQVAILIDDGLRSSFSLQLPDMKKFITDLPPGVQVLVGYMRNGQVQSDSGFSTDHAAVANSLRITISSPGVDASPYFCLSEFVKHWPSNTSGARFVMMLTNGVDPYNGSTSILNQDSPYVQTAQEDAQRAGVAVYSIAYTEAGIRGRRGSFSGQSYLNQVAEATGGQSFWQGVGNPVSLGPFLNDFRKAINESYTINFMANASSGKHSNSLTRIKVKTSQPGVKIHAPDNVRPGVVQQ
jgi:hypothetical protein